MPSRLEISAKPRVYGWAAMVDFTVNSVGGFKELGQGKTSLLWSRDLILTLEPRKIHPDLEGAGAKGFRMTVEATDTASDAEKLGLRLAYAILAVAIDRSWGVSLSWPDQPLPCRVIDRTASKGLTAQGFGSVTSHADTQSFVAAIDTAFENEVPYKVLLSMELCASSRSENDNRAKLIMLVSAFEALATQNDLSTELESLIVRLKDDVTTAKLDQSLESSLLGQIDNLRRESVSRAIQRFMKEMGFDDRETKFVGSAYSARSKVVHEGRRVPELDAMVNQLDHILRQIYERLPRGDR